MPKLLGSREMPPHSSDKDPVDECMQDDYMSTDSVERTTLEKEFGQLRHGSNIAAAGCRGSTMTVGPTGKRASLISNEILHHAALSTTRATWLSSVGRFSHTMAMDQTRQRKDDDEELASDQAESQSLSWDVRLPALRGYQAAFGDAALTFRDISFSVRDVHVSKSLRKRASRMKQILDKCSGHFEAGSLVAIMGPSGSGKSTLLDILAQRKTSAYEGEIFMNGHSIDAFYRRLISYLPQNDPTNQYWTVRQAVTFNAMMKTPDAAAMSRADFSAYIDSILECCGLEHVGDTVIGGSSLRGVSGGEKRRVGLARRIAGNFALLFCDEPTSGLSARDALLCIKALRIISSQRHIPVLVAIHQPRCEVANIFDQLFLLASNPGRVVYNGSMGNVQAYLESVECHLPYPGCTPTDYFLDLVTPSLPIGDPERFVTLFFTHQHARVKAEIEEALSKQRPTTIDMFQEEQRLSEQDGVNLKFRKSKYSTSSWQQLKVVSSRNAMILWQSKRILGDIVSSIVVWAIVGFLFWGVGDKHPQGIMQMPLLMIMLFISFSPLGDLPSHFADRFIMHTEQQEALYSVNVYILARFVVYLYSKVIRIPIELACIYFPCGLAPRYFLTVCGWVVLLHSWIDSVTGMVCSYCSGQGTATVVIGLLCQILINFNGIIVSRTTVPVYWEWAFHVSPTQWITEILAWDIYGEDQAVWRTLEDAFGFRKPNKLHVTAMILISTVIFRCLQVLFLNTKNQQRN